MQIPDLHLQELQPSDITLDQLTPAWQIYQLKRGHRFSADDIFTAYIAAKSSPKAKNILDLGSGIGSVGLLTLWQLSADTHLHMIEAQQISYQLAAKTITHNQLHDRVTMTRGDLRHSQTWPNNKFDLITGSPPYIPLGKGVMSPHPQRAACRMELRGSIANYAQTAAQLLTNDGKFVCCFAAQDPRGPTAIEKAGLFIHQEQEIIFRADLPPTIRIFVSGKTDCGYHRPKPILIRDKTGNWTTEYTKIRIISGLG